MCELIFKVKDTHAEVPSHSPLKEGRVVSSFSAPRSWTQSFKFCFLPVSSVQLSLVPTALPPMMWHFMSIQIRVWGGAHWNWALHFIFFFKVVESHRSPHSQFLGKVARRTYVHIGIGNSSRGSCNSITLFVFALVYILIKRLHVRRR